MITYIRSRALKNVTHIHEDGEYVGAIVRREGSDSSPRGRAYRTFHHPIMPSGEKLPRAYSRAEAVTHLLTVRQRKIDAETHDTEVV